MLDPQMNHVLNTLQAGGLRVISDEEGEAILPGFRRAVDLGYTTDESAADDPFNLFRLSVRGELALQGVLDPTFRQMAVAFIKQFFRAPASA